jgi:hypothetical protein
MAPADSKEIEMKLRSIFAGALALALTLARAGAPRLPWEGPLAYARRVAPRFPECAPDIDVIARHYALLRYGQSTSISARTQLRRLRTQIRHFSPR